jgi:deoxyribodipyrimidine photo-lyase
MVPAIIWFRDDLRLADNPALSAAAGQKILPIYVHDETSEGIRKLGGAAKWWLHASLASLDADLRQRGGRLLLLRGRAEDCIRRLIEAVEPGAVYWNRRYDSAGRAVDQTIKRDLKRQGIAAESFNGTLLAEPWTIRNKSGEPFRVFTPFWRAVRAAETVPPPLPIPADLEFHPIPAAIEAEAVDLADLSLLPTKPDWAGGLRAAWAPGEAGAQARLAAFLGEGLPGYASHRDRPDRPSTSRLSPYLRFGNISVRQIWQAASERPRSSATDLVKFQAELGWREFSYHLLFHQPDLAERNLQARFDRMQWQEDPIGLHAWQRGLTGYPIVDAGMRQLWTTGWMHNRVRMVTASFLIKHLMIDWRLGEAWFWDTLVDADPASNAASWQWVAGSGADAAPYFRIFNPILQGEKFDLNGAYVREFVPELARLPPSLIHRPWEASPAQLSAAGIRLGETYPLPIIDHAHARDRALQAFRGLGETGEHLQGGLQEIT